MSMVGGRTVVGLLQTQIDATQNVLLPDDMLRCPSTSRQLSIIENHAIRFFIKYLPSTSRPIA